MLGRVALESTSEIVKCFLGQGGVVSPCETLSSTAIHIFYLRTPVGCWQVFHLLPGDQSDQLECLIYCLRNQCWCQGDCYRQSPHRNDLCCINGKKSLSLSSVTHTHTHTHTKLPKYVPELKLSILAQNIYRMFSKNFGRFFYSFFMSLAKICRNKITNFLFKKDKCWIVRHATHTQSL